MDLDDLLNDIDIDALPSTANSAPKTSTINQIKPAEQIPITPPETLRVSSVGIVSSEVKPWLASSANVPKEYRERWTKMVKIDSDATVSTPFDSSNAYRLWESASSSKGGINKCLQELIRKAAQRCDIDDNKLSKVLHLANPVTDSENGSVILDAFSKQLIVDLSSDILSDPNYEPAKFPALTMMLVDFDQVGEGTYGYVYKARDKRNSLNVALKRLIFHRETSTGFPLSAVREIKFLKGLQHKNIVQLQDVVTSKGCEHLEVPIIPKLDVSNQKGDKERIDEQGDEKDKMLDQLKSDELNDNTTTSHQGLVPKAKVPWEPLKICVLEFLSEKKVLHRDIKCSNILITNKHHIKLADFGLARSALSSDGREFKTDMTNNVITMWYRPPELLLGAKRYSYAVDTWSAACVLAELELGRPLFPGRSEPEQLELISRVMGTPTEALWPGVTKLPNYESMLKSSKLPTLGFRGCYSGRLSDQSIGFLERLLVLDPTRRSSAKVALAHKYFSAAPVAAVDPATELEPLNPGGVSFHEFKTKQLRKQREAQELQAQAQAQAQTQKEDSTSVENPIICKEAPSSSKGDDSKGPKVPTILPPPPALPFPVPPPPGFTLPHPPLMYPAAPPQVGMPLYPPHPFIPIPQQPQPFFIPPMPPHHFQSTQLQYVPHQPHPFPSDSSSHSSRAPVPQLVIPPQQRGHNPREQYHHHQQHQNQTLGWSNRTDNKVNHDPISNNNNNNNNNSNHAHATTATSGGGSGSIPANIGNKRRLE